MNSRIHPLTSPRPSPFAPENTALYRRWRAWKLANYPVRAEDLVVEVQDPRALTPAEAERILGTCRKTNMVIYRSRLGALADSAAVPDAAPDNRSRRCSTSAVLGVVPPPSLESKAIVRQLAERFGLKSLDSNLLADEDSITSLEVMPEKSGRGYIPYSNRRLLWHTDGYYNPASARIRAMVLHCVRPAAEGGENALLDPEIAYIRLRDADPAHIRALMAPDAMTIPPNTEEGAERPASVGPVFAIDSAGGNLHMRYTARARSIQWKDDSATRAAVRALEQLLADDSPTVFRYRLNAGEGLLCNNVLHNRTAFRDAGDTRRLLYRARYHDRIAGTDLDDIFEA